MKEPFTIWFDNLAIDIGTVTYGILTLRTTGIIDGKAKEVMDKINQDYFSVNPKKNSLLFQNIRIWIESMINMPTNYIYYFWLTNETIVTFSAKYICIITLYSDDWIGTTLDIEVIDVNGNIGRTRKYTRSQELYPDEREEHDHYYDGRCVIWLNVEDFTQVRIKAKNCLILTF